MSFRESVRLFDRKPWTAHLYVTDQCNLDCHYCNEYDNSKPHPSLAQLKLWLAHIRQLGALRIGFQGGEPLLHPDIIELVRYAKRDLGFTRVSMATNAFLLTKDVAVALGDAGLDQMQVSIDRVTPIRSTRKALDVVRHKLGYFAETPVRVKVAGVLFGDTIDDMKQVIDYCIQQGIGVTARLAHGDLVFGKGVTLGTDTARYTEFLDMVEQRKLAGDPISSDWNTLEYQRSLLRGQEVDWTCVAGYKYFFVSAQGKFWLCSQVRTERDILTVTAEDLLGYDVKKDCQKGCGVYCIVGMSLAVSHPLRFAVRELNGMIRAKVSS